MSNTDKHALSLDISTIKQYQKNKHPYLFIDKITEVIPGKCATGLKAFSYNEWFFPSHFEDDPIVPGFIQVECLEQVFLMIFLSIKEFRGHKTSTLSTHNIKFGYRICPGEALVTKAVLTHFKRGIAKGAAKGYIEGHLACSAEFSVAIPSLLEKFKPNKFALKK